MSVSSFSLLVLLYLSYVNLFKELFLYLYSPTEIQLILVLLEVLLFLVSGCKGITFP